MHTETLRVVHWSMRGKLHAITGVSVLFLSFYGQVVCPLMDSLSLSRIVSVLAVVYGVQIIIREWFYYQFPKPRKNISLSRHGFHISVFTWIIAGIIAAALHAYLYQDFHWSSHAKLLSGYWGLGAGILSQLEYVILESYFRTLQKNHTSTQIHEHFIQRLMQGYAVFTIVPALMMVLVSFRFVFEGYTDRNAALEVLFLGVCFVFSGLFVAWRYGHALKMDCDHLLEAVNHVSQGHFQIKLDTSRGDELGCVADGVNSMAKGLVLRERIQDAFGRFVNPEVANRFIEHFSKEDNEIKLGGERREVAILMADIRNFTPLSESMNPEELTHILNGYFSEMVKAIQQNGGMVDKFIGDAIMAVFGLSEGRENFVEDAVSASLEMRTRLKHFNDQQAQKGQTILDNGIGIHVGQVIAGYIGSADRLEFTVIGHAVNVAARIEGQTKPPNPPILFSETVANRIQNRFQTQQVGGADLKGVSKKIHLFTLSNV